MILLRKWCPRTDSNRGPIDYKSIALPAELQGHALINRIFSLISQLNQSILNLYPARMLRMLAAKVPQCRAIVTHLSVYYRYENPIRSGISQSSFSSLKQNKMEWKNEKEKTWTNIQSLF